MILFKVIILNNLLLHYILMIILIGILIFEKFKKKRDEQKGILSYIILCLSITIFIIIDTLRYIGIKLPDVILLVNPVLAITIGFAILWNSYRIKNKTNKTLSFIIFLFTFPIAMFEVFKSIFGNMIYWLVGSLLAFIATLLLYYVVIYFLIKSDG